MPDRLAIIQAEESVKEIRKIIAEARPLVSIVKDLNKEVASLNSRFNAGKPREYAEAMRNLTEVSRQYNSIQRQVSTNMERLSRIERNNTQTAAEAARVRRETARALNEESRARQQLQREQTQNNRNTANATDAYKRFSREVLEAKNKAKSLGAEMILLEREFKNGNINRRDYNRQMNQLSREFVEARTRALGLHEQIRRLDASVGDNQRNVGNYRSALNGLTTSFRNLLGAFGVTGAISMFATLVQSSFETIKVLNAQNVALNQIFETQTQVAFQQEYLSDLTNRLGLELVSTTASYTKYSASVKDTALEGEKARNIFAAFSGASAKLGLNAEAQTGIFRALEQMISKGTVQAEELRGQLGDRMPGAFKLFADAAGVTTKQLGEMMKKGDVLAGDILPKVADRLNKVYDLDSTTKADTLVAAQNRLTNSWTAFLNMTSNNKEVLSGLALGMESLGDVLNFLLDTLILKGTDGVSVVGDLVDVLKSLFDAVTSIATSLGLMNEKTKNSLLSINQFRNDLKAMQSVIAVLTGAIKGLADTVSAFFETMFQDDGWDKFMKRIDEADKKILKIWDTYEKTQAGVKKANQEGTVYNDEASPYIKAWTEARKAKQYFFQLNGKYFNTSTGRNTGKSLDDYIDVGNVLKKKDKNKGDNEEEKTEKYKASKLSGIQRDYLKDLQASRDLELALNETAYLRGLKSEKEYLNTSLNINNDYFNKKISYLKGKNAEERKQRADAILDQKKMEKEFQKKIFEIDKKQIDENYKKQTTAFDRRSKFFDNSDFEDNSGRLESEIALNEQRLESAKDYYSNLIDTAKKANQDTLEIERKRDDEIGNIEDDLYKKRRSRLETYTQDLDILSQTASNAKILTFEEQRSLILNNKKLTNSEREYQLSILEKNNQIELNKLEIIRLNTLKDKLSAKEFITKEDEKQLSEYTAQIKALENTNIEINIDIKNDIDEKTQAVRDALSKGFSDLGFSGLADAYAATMERLKGETASWRDYAVLAASAVLDSLTQLNNKQKENAIANLDEQLKHSQETTEQEIGFINERLGYLNGLDEMTKEQESERNRLEDEGRTLKEQQFQREKVIEAQKARAEQKAAAQQALINGALAATMSLAQYGFTPAGGIAAALALAFGIAQSIAISSRNPVPQYWVGRQDGPAEWAWRDEKGPEIHADKNDNIISLGSNKGPQMTWLNKGDKIYTADQSKRILKDMDSMPKIGQNLFRKAAFKSLQAPSMNLVVNNNTPDYSQKIIDGLAQRFDLIMKRNSNPDIQYINGKIIQYQGSNNPLIRGTYDPKTGEETWYQ